MSYPRNDVPACQATSKSYASEGNRNTTGTPRVTTLREETEKNASYHRQQADKQEWASSFFRENPAFDEFILLIRSGAVSI